ncbi:hypothetical protein EBZ80_19800 [bacterium]|nr:hypothetical protein [bacterium]
MEVTQQQSSTPSRAESFAHLIDLLPIRCYTCNKVLARYTVPFLHWRLHHADEEPLLPFFEEYKIARYCCRRVFLAVPRPALTADESCVPSTVTVLSTTQTDDPTKVLPHRFYLAR